MKPRWLFIGGVFGLLALAWAAAMLIENLPYQYQGTLFEPAQPVGDFLLTDQNGQSWRLSDHRGKALVLFFGYTFCPDVCPVTLADFLNIQKTLGRKAENVEFIFITVDPQRDTAEHLKTFLSKISPSFIGLTGTQPELEAVWNTFGVTVQIDPVEGPADYLVSHTARTYVIDPAGDLRLTYSFRTEPDVVAQDVAHLLDEK